MSRFEGVRMPPATVTPAPPYRVTELSIEDGMDIAMWQVPGPWTVQDSLEPPRPDEGFWAVRDANDALIGYCCFGKDARPLNLPGTAGRLDVALGIAPRFTGKHLSGEFAQTVVDRARDVSRGRTLRCVIPEWNAVGRRIAGAVGFQLKGVEEFKSGAAVTILHIYEMPKDQA